MARAELDLHSIPELLKQAIISYKASIWIFLTISLLSCAYETAIDRATDLSGFSINLSNTSVSVDIEFRGKSFSQYHFDHDDKGNVSLLGRFLSSLFAPTSTNATSQQWPQNKRKENTKQIDDVSVQAETQQFGSYDIGDQLAQTNEGNNKQPNELEMSHNEKPGEPETLDKVPVESEDAHSEKPIQLGNPPEGAKNEDLGDSGITSDENLSPLKSDAETTHNVSSGEPGNIHTSQLRNESGSFPDVGAEASEDGGETIRPPIIGSLKLVRRYGNETNKDKKLRRPLTKTSSSAGVLNQGAMPSGDERTLVLLLSIVMLVSVVILLVLTFAASVVLGVVPFAVASTHISKRASLLRSLRSSFRSGIWRLMWFTILLGFLQELQTQFLTKILFEEVLEKDQIEKLLYRLSVMPFAILAPLKDDLATGMGMFLRIGAFVCFRYMIDWLIYSTYIMGCWVSIMEREYSGHEALNRGWNLVKSMPFQAAMIKLLEAIFCGRSFIWMLNKVGGQFFGTFMVTLVQTYFLVLWLVLYYAARCKENEGEGRRFSHQDLEDFLNKLR